MENSDLTWGTKVKIAMLQKHMSMEELAKRVGRTRTYVSAIVNGRLFAEPTNKLISDVLDIEYEEVRR